MLDFFLQLPLAAGIILFIISTIIAGDLIYLLTYRLFTQNHLKKKHEKTGRLLFKSCAGLLSLLLSFTFASQRVDHYKVKNSLEVQASQMVSIHTDLGQLSDSSAINIQKKLRDYVSEILAEGWQPLTDNPSQSRTLILFHEIYKDILRLKTENPMEENLKNSIISNFKLAAESIQVRIYQSRPETPYLFYIAILGFIIIMILYSVYKPDKISVLFISLYNAFIGIVMYFIILLNNPLAGPLHVGFEPFQILEKSIKAKY
ncbi:MAG TPA: hypothetical protein PK228_03425 [Saprospiraceae bacterium]|nr:hypothetical protein [Saprospiraceae bacterium]